LKSRGPVFVAAFTRGAALEKRSFRTMVVD
jgi:hypothetical protein